MNAPLGMDMDDELANERPRASALGKVLLFTDRAQEEPAMSMRCKVGNNLSEVLHALENHYSPISSNYLFSSVNLV